VRGRDHFCAIAHLEIPADFKKFPLIFLEKPPAPVARCAKIIIFAQRAA